MPMMFDAYGLLEEMRTEIRSKLPDTAFLRIDRKDALFVSNAPVYISTLPDFDLYDVSNDDRLLRITPSCEYIQRLEDSLCVFPDRLSVSLSRFRGEVVERTTQAIFIDCLKLSCGRHAIEEIELLDTRLRKLAALALRKTISGGGLALCAVLLYSLVQ